jgi:predicted enzyme related to lactoylglutathione lyase
LAEEEPMSQAEHDRRIDYVEFAATDIDRTKQFYQDAFGWRFEDYGPDYTSFQDGRLAGGFERKPSVRVGGPLIVIYARDLAALQASVTQAGGTIVRPPYSFPGGRRFHFTDPSGNELAVWTDQ